MTLAAGAAATAPAPLHKRHRTRIERVKHCERLLDEALEESFPASDPPSIAVR